MKKKLFQQFLFIILTMAIYFAFLLPSQWFLELFDGTGVRIAIAIPISFGIVFGYPAAIGIFLGNLAFDLIFNPGAIHLILLGSLANALACVGMKFLFSFVFKCKECVVNDIKSLLFFILSILIINLLLACFVSFLLKAYANSPFWSSFYFTFLNNIEFSLIFALPMVTYLPLLHHTFEDEKSIKHKTFRFIVVFGILASILLCVIVYIISFRKIELWLEKWQTVFLFSAIVLAIILSSFLAISAFIEKKVTNPLFALAKNVKFDDENKDEISTLLSRLDFVASNKESMSGNEFSLYIGLTTRSGETYSYSQAKHKLDDICLKYVTGFISSEGDGGYKGETQNSSEQVLIYKIFGASDEQISSIVKESLVALNQESILVEKNRSVRWYIYNK